MDVVVAGYSDSSSDWKYFEHSRILIFVPVCARGGSHPTNQNAGAGGLVIVLECLTDVPYRIIRSFALSVDSSVNPHALAH